MSGPFAFDEPSARRVVGAVEEFESQSKNRASFGSRDALVRDIQPWREGILDGDLDAPVDIFSPTTATVSIYGFDAGGSFVDTGEDLIVTNRDSNAIGNAGEYIIVRRINNEWRPAGAQIGGGGLNRDGKAVYVTTISHSLANDEGFILFDGDAFPGGTIQTLFLPAGSESNEGNYVTIVNIGSTNDVEVTADLTTGGTSTNTITPGGIEEIQSEGALGIGSTGWWFV